MTNIVFLTDAIYYNIFRWKYVGNEKDFENFFSPFSKFRFNFELFQKNDDSHS